MASQTKIKKSQSNQSDPVENHSNQLKEIQNLLFGEQLNHVEKQISSFQTEIEKRLETIERSLQANIDSQAAEFTDALTEQSESLNQLQSLQSLDNEDIKSALEKVNKLILNNSDKHISTENELKNGFQKEIEKIKTLIDQQSIDIKAQIEKSVQVLSQSKTDRKVLAKLFQSVVNSLENK